MVFPTAHFYGDLPTAHLDGRPGALAGDVEINPCIPSFSPTKSASGSCTSRSYGSSIEAIFLGFVLLSVFLDIK